ncbi:MAG: hypothetical protein C4526_02570 [Nitrospiraceae bacterium]|nr:MAG: hypothetical protein C4526_02570 [Nitrospiraceae bacterium]
MRSRSAAALLKGQGFEKTYSIKGGIDAWNGLRAAGPYDTGIFSIEGSRTTEELVFLAWSLEEGARVFYKAARACCEEEQSKKIFDRLVKDEEKHKAVLAETYLRLAGEAAGRREFGEESIYGLMEGGVSVAEALTWLKQKSSSAQDVLEFSMQLETNSLDLYMKVLREAEDEKTREVFRILIDEEKQHLSALGNLFNSMYNVS